MTRVFIQLATAFAGSLGFCLVFHLRKQLLLLAGIGSILCWSVYLIGENFFTSAFVPCLIASGVAALYAEILARIKKAPATLFVVTAILPLIPGSKLYYTMSNIVQKEWDMAKEYGLQTAEYALAIACGISFVWAVCVMIQNVLNKWKENKRTCSF